MARVFLIENETPGKFLSPWGWTPNKETALQFTLEQDARQHIGNDLSLRSAKHAVVPHDAPEGPTSRGYAETDYDPYGLRR